MKNRPILIVAGQPKSIFFEIFFKTIKLKSFSSPLILIASKKELTSQMKKFNFKKKVKLINYNFLDTVRLNNKTINLIDVKYNNPKKYVYDCFDIAFKILKNKYTNKLINGPINKSKFLNNKFPGITEYVSKKFKIKKFGMLIYNDKLSVCPLTTHLSLKSVPKKINKKLIKEKVFLLNNFYKKFIGYKPKIGVTGLNPHCESILKVNEDRQILAPTIKELKNSGYSIFGPFPADTIFLKKNREKFNVILGMYHDQVLTPLKTLFEYDAINITIGLPFIRVSPDHGPNEKMIGKNLSNPQSLIKAIKFLDKK